MFATSGALTNWLAVHMLFERVPLLYGSGVIPARFEEFKGAIRELIMEQFFTRENVERFFQESGGSMFDPVKVADSVDYDQVFQQLLDAVNESPLGGLLGMVGGPAALDPVKAPFQAKMRGVVEGLVASDRFHAALQGGSGLTDGVVENVDGIVQARLDELTPQMVKEIVQDMIRQHLGWLVVWGGVFGGLMGVIAHFLT